MGRELYCPYEKASQKPLKSQLLISFEIPAYKPSYNLPKRNPYGHIIDTPSWIAKHFLRRVYRNQCQDLLLSMSFFDG